MTPEREDPVATSYHLASGLLEEVVGISLLSEFPGWEVKNIERMQIKMRFFKYKIHISEEAYLPTKFK